MGMIDNLLGEEAYCDVYCIKRCENDADCVDGFCPQNGWCVSQTCPNDEIEGPEVCDGTDLEGATCESLGFVSGALGCLSDCSDFDTSSCVAPVCQDETAEGFEVCDGADALVIVTEWNEFRALDLGRVKELLSEPILIDLRNIYDPETMQAAGFHYLSVGR